VVVNDMNKENAEKVVGEIKKGAFFLLPPPFLSSMQALTLFASHSTAGGKAVAVVASTLEGEKLVKAALDAFGSLHGMFSLLSSSFLFSLSMRV
jgi:multifunctional beta-oxidation protein